MKKQLFTLMPLITGALLLSACATGPDVTTHAAPVTATLDAAMADAERSVAAGDAEKAYAILKNAGARFPADKAPWVQLAQLKFDRGSYGDAISNALEGLQRDPADRQGNSIVAVAGLRLSTKAVADLSQHNHLGGPLRTEAQQLASLLRSTLGEEVLVPAAKAARPAPKKPAVVPAGGQGRKTASTQSTGADPFGALK
jgi:predicted Zn-dependent protease